MNCLEHAGMFRGLPLKCDMRIAEHFIPVFNEANIERIIRLMNSSPTVSIIAMSSKQEVKIVIGRPTSGALFVPESHCLKCKDPFISEK
jgi:hypothetical protein